MLSKLGVTRIMQNPSKGRVKYHYHGKKQDNYPIIPIYGYKRL